MNIKCPHCGTEYEAEEKDLYRYTKCSVCGEGFVAGADTSVIASDDKPNGPADSPRSGKFAPRRVQGASSRAERIAIPGRFARPQDDTDAVPSPDGPKTKSRMKKVLVLFGSVVAAIVVGCAVAFGAYQFLGAEPRLNRGIAYYEKGLYPNAYKLLLPLARKGNAKAQLYVGDCLANGQGVFMDTEEAVKWYRLAADQELPEAQHRMFACCMDGVGIERNPANAAKWCRKAAEAGHGDAMFDMGMLYVSGTGVEENAKGAFRWFRKGAERGHTMCLYKFGQCYKLGFGVEKDEDEASKWQNKAVAEWRTNANAGDTSAMRKLADLYMSGDVVELDKEEAVKWFRKGAELGDEKSQYELATCYHKGVGVEEDQEESAKWMLKSAEKGTDRIVQWAMGRYYQEGWGVEKNSAEAVKWFERSAKKGFALAKYYLAMCYMNGDGVNKDESKAGELLKDAAAAGCDEAKDELARINREREERNRRLAAEKAEKNVRLKRLVTIEDRVEERARRVNDILNGKLSDEWAGFNASKISTTDSSASVKEEDIARRLSEKLSDADSLEAIEIAIKNATSEANRLQARLDKINDIKEVYDAKELESRKETCSPCNGTGAIVCARCKGNGEVLIKVKKPCPTCVVCARCQGNGEVLTCVGTVDDDDDLYGGLTASDSGRKGKVRRDVVCSTCNGSGLTASYSVRKGQVRRHVVCSTCNGNGRVRRKCGSCGGKKKLAIEEPGRLRRYERCNECNGSGFGYPEECPKCGGDKKLEVWQTCGTCQGRCEVVNGRKETCPVCKGKGKLKCERCDGRGFTYRPKDSVGN